MSKKKDSLKPWLSRPAVNRSVTLPLTRPLTQRLSNLNEFHPNELDPYLLFDARDSMIGTLENPTLDLDPSKPDTLNVITATRSGTATYTDANGNIATAAADTVRVDYVDSVPMILVEPSATNLLTATQEVSSWSSADVSVTSNTTTAPDGSQTGDTVTRTAGGGNVRQTKVVTSGTSYTMSIFAKAETDNQIQLDFSNSSMGDGNVEFNTRTGQKVSGSNNYTITELANGWRRYSFTSTCISSGNTGVIIRIENDEPVQLWGFQFEEGSVATSYIPALSGSTVTRAADDLVISGSDFSDFYNQSEGTFYVESELQRATEASFQPFLFSADNGDANRLGLYYASGGGGVRGFVRVSNVEKQLGFGAHPAVDTLSRTAFSYKTNNLRGSIDGSSVTPLTNVAIPTTISKLDIGSHLLKYQHLWFNGHIKRLIYWPYHSDSL
jgi:hypothetical protein